MVALARLGFHVFGYLSHRVRDEEIIVRAIFSPYHVDSKKRLKPEAFTPSYGTDEISVMRSSILGARWCKRKARGFEDPANRKVFRGFAVLSVRAVNKDFRVVDSRKNNFVGHGDIKTGLKTPPKGVPRPAHELQILRDHCKKLLSLSTYREDPSPAQPRWGGGELVPE